MATKRDFYEVLGVAKSATAADIKKAYRTQARKHHPDVDKSPDAHEKFKEINEAYQVLSDTTKKQTYDQFGHDAFNGSGGGRSGGGQQQYQWGNQGGGAGFEGFRDPFEIFEEFFSGSSAGRQGARSGQSRGEDLQFEITIPFEQVVFGVEKKVSIDKQVACNQCKGSGKTEGSRETTCGTCNGRGQVNQQTNTIFGSFMSRQVCPGCEGVGKIVKNPCNKCKGSGRVKDRVEVTIKIPAGVESGQTIRFPRLGNQGTKGQESGDLYLLVHVLASRDFIRRGNSIYSETEISMTEAALGTVVEVATVDGEVSLRIPTGTQSGTEFRLRDHGVPYLGSKGRGDQIVKIKVKIPTKMSRRQQELLKEFNES